MPHSDSTPHPRPRPLLLLFIVTMISILLRIFPGPELIESLYSRGLYIYLRPAFDYTIGLLPFPVIFLFWLMVIGLVIREVFLWRSNWKRGCKSSEKVLFLLRGVARFFCLITISFLWLWGMNYGRTDVEDELDFTTYEPTLEELRERVFATAEELAQLRRSFKTDTTAVTAAELPDDLESSIRPLISASLRRHGYPAPGRPRGWRLLPKGILLHLSTSGVYWPWAAQGNIDAGLHPLQQPAVLAHELGHAYGFGDEGSCSFWAYLAASETDDPALVYALELAYWRQIAGLLRYADPEGYLAWREESLDAGIKNDLAAIYANAERYWEVAPLIRDAAYTTYLHAQGIQDGMLNYGRVVELVEGYRRNYGASR